MTAQARASATRSAPAPTVFISYSHKDERWKNQVVTHLGVLGKQGLLDIWVDTKIGAGEDWYAEIKAAMRRAKVAVLIVTADFLNSPFILGEEVPALLQRRKKSGMRIVPIVARPCAWKAVDWLNRIQLRPKDAQPLSSLRQAQREQYLTDLAHEISAMLSGDKAATAARPRGSTVKQSQSGRQRPRGSTATTKAEPAAAAANRPRLRQRKPQEAQGAVPSTVRSSGSWLLLDEEPYVSTSVIERGEDISMRIPAKTSAEDSALRQLKGKFASGYEPFGWAYQNDAALVTLTSAERESQGEKAEWLITVRRSDRQSNSLLLEASFNGISADQLATMRARLLLLNERLDLGRDGNDYFLESMLQGTTSPVKVTEGMFPRLWASPRRDTAIWLRQARLRAVYALKLSHICEHIQDLTLGPITRNRLAVKFRGVRAKRFSNEPPATVAVTGLCPLKG
jgi:hypothetical protein